MPETLSYQIAIICPIGVDVRQVCFNTSGLTYFVKHRANGYAATCFDHEDLARGLYWALFQSNSASVRRTASRIAQELFDPRTNVLQLENAIDEAIEKYGLLSFDEDEFAEIGGFVDDISDNFRFRHVYRRTLEKKSGISP